ncbi:MAG: hypothetical protein IKZ66_09115 [Schwartzia sp.]|nr:hypothetical protein [Schwartzia sp. (in: firmicutes)]
MSEAERIEVPEETLENDTPQEAEAAATFEISQPGAGAAPESAEMQDGLAEDVLQPDEATEAAAHGLSNATLESMSRTDPQAQAVAEAEKTKWERRKAFVRDRVQSWCRQYMADGGFKLGIALVTAVIAAAIIVIAGIISDRQLGVVFWRAVTGFFVSGIFMGGTLYWLDRFGIPLFIAKHEEQIQMEWLAEAEEPEAGEQGEPAEGEAGEPEPGELEELMPQGEEGTLQEESGTELSEQDNTEALETDMDNPESQSESEVSAEGEVPEAAEEAQPTDAEAASGEDIGELENAVLDDAFSSVEAEGEPEEPPTFAPMTADNLESISVPDEA